MHLHHSIGIFDAGIGSYAIVERIRFRFPKQDIIYYADRASFPYGTKTPDVLLASVRGAAEYLISKGCSAIALASNAPSIVVLNALQAAVSVPIIGVFPPIREALARSHSKYVAVLGVQSMVISDAMQRYVKLHSESEGHVALINASPLVAFVENFDFLNNQHSTQEKVLRFIADVRLKHPQIDVMTMSSTHLPWLKPFFQTAAPDLTFLDPADKVLEQLFPHTSLSRGQALFIATETAELSLKQFNSALQQLGAPQQAELRR